jgi:hypothetical protein
MSDVIRELQGFIDERWQVAGQRFYLDADAPQVPPELTATEAEFFLACVNPRADEGPLLVIDDDRKARSDRYPRLTDGSPRGYLFFEEPGRLRLETLVGWAAMARLHHEFGWPREHLIAESPRFVSQDCTVLQQDAVDTLLLEEPCLEPRATMPLETTATRVGVEAKATATLLDSLLSGMRACQEDGVPHPRTDHVKCCAIAKLRPRLFLGVAAGNHWRLFRVVDRNGRAVLGEELADLDELNFIQMN